MARLRGVDRVESVRVLIVDDQPEFRRAARELLQARGFEVAGEAGSAAAAVDAAARLAPDAVLLDVGLGEDSGFDVSSALTRTNPALAVLLVSCNDYGPCGDELRRSGARGFVLKSRLVATDFGQYWPAAFTPPDTAAAGS
jgi:DNA-binding NarL/FixJ family response regulator